MLKYLDLFPYKAQLPINIKQNVHSTHLGGIFSVIYILSCMLLTFLSLDKVIRQIIENETNTNDIYIQLLHNVGSTCGLVLVLHLLFDKVI